MTVKNLVNQDTFITIHRNDWDKEVEVDSVETLWIPYHDEDDQFSVEFSGFDESLSSISVRLYISVKTMEFLCHEFNEYKKLNRNEREPEEAVSTPSEVKTDTSNTAGNPWAELTSLLSDTSADSLNIAVLVSRTIGAISVFEKFIEQGERGETIPILLEKFPWLLGRDKEALSANQYTKIEGFVFLSSYFSDEMLVIRSKQGEVGKSDYQELRACLDFIYDRFPTKNGSIHGLLIGYQKGELNDFDTRIQVVSWSEILEQSEQSYLAYLEVLLKSCPELSEEDERVRSIKKFGGNKVEELLQKIL